MTHPGGGERLLAEELMGFAPWPGRANATARYQQSGTQSWTQYVDSIGSLMPPHAVRSSHEAGWTWTTPSGVWNLELAHPNRAHRVGDRVRVWLGFGWDTAQSRWCLDDPTITHVMGFLVVVGALDWERPEEDRRLLGDSDA